MLKSVKQYLIKNMSQNATETQRKRDRSTENIMHCGRCRTHGTNVRQLFVIGMIFVKEQVSPKIKRHHINRQLVREIILG